MAYVERGTDAGFYNLIHEVLESSPQGSPQGSPRGQPVDRRKHRRESFPAMQRIAPRRGTKMPDESEFFEVQCHDLTRAGFSFFLPEQPDFDSLVATFSGDSAVIYVSAEIVNCDGVLIYSSGKVERMAGRPVEIDDQDPIGRSAKPMVLVHCRFTERLRI